MSRKPNFSVNESLLTVAICMAALALRWKVATDAFWLDEIWSYYLTQVMGSSWDAFTVIRIDNNHLLNTLYMYWVGDQANWIVYRLPAIASGVVLVALMGPAAKQVGAQPWLAMVLAAVSLPLIQYAAEARGYSMAAMLGLASWYVYTAHLRTKLQAGPVMLFWVCCMLGLLAHQTFIFVYVALGASWLITVFAGRPFDQRGLKDGLLCFTPPTIFLIWIYLFFYSQASAGGANLSLDLFANMLELLRLSSGTPANTFVAISGSAVFLGLILIGLRAVESQLRIFFVMVFIVPAVLLTLYQPDFFYPRYLLVLLPFAYLLSAKALYPEPAASRSLSIKNIGLSLAIVIVAGSLWQYRQLAELGKGDYPQAVNDLYNNAGGQNFTVGSDFDFRNKTLLDFYARYQAKPERMSYTELAYEQKQPVDYFFTHNQQTDHIPPETLSLPSGAYTLVKSYPYFGLSGWQWNIYRYQQP